MNGGREVTPSVTADNEIARGVIDWVEREYARDRDAPIAEEELVPRADRLLLISQAGTKASGAS